MTKRVARTVSSAAGALAGVLALACSAHGLNDQGSPQLDHPVTSSVAAPDKVRLFIGQDVDSIEAYAGAVSTPVGIVSYTSIQGLEGLDTPTDNGGGTMHLSRLVDEFPGAPVALGFYLVGALEAINQGRFDAALDRLGDRLKSYDTPVLLRVGYEFDGPWNQYEPTAYVQAFVRIRQRLGARGASRVEYVWQAAASCGGTQGGAPVDSWYPGDDAVDWIAASYFTQADCQFAPLKRLLTLARAHQKPFMLAESTPQGYDLCGGTFSRNGVDRVAKSTATIFDEWYQPYFDFIAQNRDVVRATSYINANWNAQRLWSAPYADGYFGDSRVQCNAESQALWQGQVAAEYFQ